MINIKKYYKKVLFFSIVTIIAVFTGIGFASATNVLEKSYTIANNMTVNTESKVYNSSTLSVSHNATAIAGSGELSFTEKLYKKGLFFYSNIASTNIALYSVGTSEYAISGYGNIPSGSTLYFKLIGTNNSGIVHIVASAV